MTGFSPLYNQSFIEANSEEMFECHVTKDYYTYDELLYDERGNLWCHKSKALEYLENFKDDLREYRLVKQSFEKQLNRPL